MAENNKKLLLIHPTFPSHVGVGVGTHLHFHNQTEEVSSSNGTPLLLTFQWLKQDMCPRLTSTAGEIHSLSTPRNGEGDEVLVSVYVSNRLYIYFLSLSLFLLLSLSI